MNIEKQTAFTAKKIISRETKKGNEYRKELEIMNKIMEEKCNAYEEKKTSLVVEREEHMQQLQRTIKEKNPGMNKEKKY